VSSNASGVINTVTSIFNVALYRPEAPYKESPMWIELMGVNIGTI
jgi:hypothetical protein